MKTNRAKIITIFIFFFIFLLSFQGVRSDDSLTNPYGEGCWEIHQGNMRVIYSNGSQLETRVPSEQFDIIKTEITSENEHWSEVKMSWERDSFQSDYYKNKTIPDYDNLTFRVKKSNNMAYLKRTEELYGFFPLYIYKYTSTEIMDDEAHKKLDLDKRYEIEFIKETGLLGNIKIENSLSFRSVKEIEFVEKGTKTPKDLQRPYLRVSAKGHYPITYSFYLPAHYLIENITDEEYVKITNSLDHGQKEAIEFVKKIDNGPPITSNIYTILQVAVFSTIVLVTIISIFLYYVKGRKK